MGKFWGVLNPPPRYGLARLAKFFLGKILFFTVFGHKVHRSITGPPSNLVLFA